MQWTAYKVVWRLLTPMHIGAGALGNVQRTRPYVIGKAFWGALTARLTREDDQWNDNYSVVGAKVSEELAFTYFYPAIGDQVDKWPWGNDADEFAWRYLGTYASTALNYQRNSAEDGSLHETEYIAPTTRDDKPVYLIGYVFEQAGCSLSWRDALSRLQLGGERTYGWGRVCCEQVAPTTENLFNQFAVELDHGRPVIQLTKDSRLLAHAPASGTWAVNAQGVLAPLVGRETKDGDKHGQSLEQVQTCWEPGARITTDKPIAIAPMGIWNSA